MKTDEKIVAVDKLSWKIAHKENKSMYHYRKYLDEAFILLNDGQNSINLYKSTYEHFKRLSSNEILITSTGEYTVSFSGSDRWYSRNKNAILKSYYELVLKIICLSDEVSPAVAVARVAKFTKEDISKLKTINLKKVK